MSRETLEWLNNNVLVGFTEKRGPAWHGRMGDDNHYVGPVPVQDVRKRLFSFEVEERPVVLGRQGGHYVVPDADAIPGLKAIVRKDTGQVFDVVGANWVPHLYDEWLIRNVEHILDDDLQIGTAGLLEGGGKAWVQVERPDTVTFAGGVTARPFLLAATALSRKLSTTYGLSVTNTVCDNTMSIAMTEHGGWRHRTRHSKKSLEHIGDVREALGIVFEATDEFGKQVEALLDIDVPEYQFTRILESEAKVQRKRDFIRDLYHFDARVQPWCGTGYGVWQAFNTYAQHESTIRKSTIRVERNVKHMIGSEQARADQRILEKIGALA